MKDKTVKPKFFNVYLDSEEIVRLLSDEDRGKLFSMLLSFARTGDTPDISDNPALAIAFKVFAAQIERDFEAYEKKVTAGKRGGAPKGNRNASKQTSKNNQNNQEEEKEEEKDKDKDKDKDEDKDENKDENKEQEDPSAEADAYAAAADVISLFDSLCSPLPKAGAVTENRILLINKARPALNGTGFEEYFRRVAKSDFLTGRSGKWRGCTLDWLLRPDTISKVLNGTYDDRAAPPRASYDLERLEEIDTLDFIT